MKNIPADYKGEPLREGVLVAFNYSGQVRLGRIVGVKEKPYPKHYPEYLRTKRIYTFWVEHLSDPELQSKIASQDNLCSLEGLLI